MLEKRRQPFRSLVTITPMLKEPALPLVGGTGIFIRIGVIKGMAVVGHCLSSLSSIESVGQGWHGCLINGPVTMKSMAEGLAVLLIVPSLVGSINLGH